MKNLKNKFILASAILALASCADNSYLGENEEKTSAGGGAISFGSSTPSLTRAEGALAASELGYSFAVYATKTVNSVTSNVFAQNTYAETEADANNDSKKDGAIPYWVWYQASTANNTTSNSANWEYVGTGGSVITPAITAQTIKYWDEFASQYEFLAYKAKPVGTEPAAASITNLTTTGFTAQGTIEQLAALYIADKKVVTSGDYGKEVEFTFRKAASKVRLGIYETIPGYDVKDIKFKYNSTEDTDEAYLTGQFIYSNTAATFDVTYSGTPLKAVLTPASGTSYNATYFNFGSFDSSSKIGETSSTPTWTNTSTTNYYKDVLPNISNVGAMTLTIDYTLINTVSGETINITGATATVPAKYMTWNPNYAYTYLFKITDDKLTPITFDAVTIDDGEGNQETITTVTEPSITTFGVKGDVYSIGKNEYETGSDIYVTIMDNNSVADPTLGTNINVYSVSTSDATNFPITEASVAESIAHSSSSPKVTCTGINDNPSSTYFTAVPAKVTTVPGENGVNKTINALKLTGVQVAGAYAVEYINGKAYTPGNGTDVSDGTWFTNVQCTTDATGTADGNTTYYKRENKTYKVIKVVAAPANP